MNHKLEDQINISRKKERQMRGVLMGDDNADGISGPGRESEFFRQAFEFSGIEMALVSRSEDITELKEEEQALRAREKFLSPNPF